MSNCSCCGSRCKCTVSCCNGCAPYYMVNIREGKVIYYNDYTDIVRVPSPRMYNAYEDAYWYISDPGELYYPRRSFAEYSNKTGFLRALGAMIDGTSAPSVTEYSVTVTVYTVEAFYWGSDMTTLTGGRESEIFSEYSDTWDGGEYISVWNGPGPIPPNFQIPGTYAIPVEIYIFVLFNGKTYTKRIASLNIVNGTVTIPFDMTGFQEMDINAAPLPYTQSIPNGGSVDLTGLDYSNCNKPKIYSLAQTQTTRLSTAQGLKYFQYQYPGQPPTPGFQKKGVKTSCRFKFNTKMTLSGLKIKTYSICNHNTGEALDNSGQISLSTGISVDESNVPGAPECLADDNIGKLEKGNLCDGLTTNPENIVTVIQPISCPILNDSDDDSLVAEYEHVIPVNNLSPFNRHEVFYNEKFYNYDNTMIETTCGRFPPILKVVYIKPNIVSGYYIPQSGTIEYSSQLSNSDFAIWEGRLVDMWGSAGVRFQLKISIIDSNNYYKVFEIYENGGLKKRDRCKNMPLSFAIERTSLFDTGLTIYVV